MVAALLAPFVSAAFAPGALAPPAEARIVAAVFAPAPVATPALPPGRTEAPTRSGAAAGTGLEAEVAAAPAVTPSPPSAAPAPPVETPPPATAEPVPAPAPAAEAATVLAGVIESGLADRRLAGTTLGVSVWVDGLGEVTARNPDVPLVPASNQKLFTAMAVLSLLPPSTVLVTEVRATGPVEGGTLLGDLVLVGGGDPTLESRGAHSLDELAALVWARGIERVAGSLVGDETRYDRRRVAAGWRPWEVPTYIGPLSALVVDRNRYRRDAEYAADPLPGNLARFRDSLRRTGVTVAGGNIAGAAPHSTLVASLPSPPVEELVARMLTDSDNLVAELLLKEIGLRAQGVGGTAEGAAAGEEALRRLGVPLRGRTADGSGLSRADRRSAREWRLLLQAALDQPWGAKFLGSLPLAGRTGTLDRRFAGTAAEANVRAKTGAIQGARALSGYLTTAGGRPVVFSIVVNGTGPGRAMVHAIDDLVAAIAADPA